MAFASASQPNLPRAGSPTGCALVPGVVNPTYRSSLPFASDAGARLSFGSDVGRCRDAGTMNPTYRSTASFTSTLHGNDGGSSASATHSQRTCIRMVSAPQPSRPRGWALVARGLTADPSAECLKRHFNSTSKKHVDPMSVRKTSLLPQNLPSSRDEPEMPCRRRPASDVRSTSASNPLEAPAEIGSRRGMPYESPTRSGSLKARAGAPSEGGATSPPIGAPHRVSEGAAACLSPPPDQRTRLAPRSWSPPSERTGVVEEFRRRNQGSEATRSLIQGEELPLAERANSDEPRPSRRKSPKSPRPADKDEKVDLNKGLNRSSSNECLLNHMGVMQKRKFSPTQRSRPPWEQLQDTPRLLRRSCGKDRSQSPPAPFARDDETMTKSPPVDIPIMKLPYGTDADLPRQECPSIAVNPPEDQFGLRIASIMQSNNRIEAPREDVEPARMIKDYIVYAPNTLKSAPQLGGGAPPRQLGGGSPRRSFFGSHRLPLGNDGNTSMMPFRSVTDDSDLNDNLPLKDASPPRSVSYGRRQLISGNGCYTPTNSSPKITQRITSGCRTPRLASRTSPLVYGCRTPRLAPRPSSPTTAGRATGNRVTNRANPLGSPTPTMKSAESIGRLYDEKIKMLGSEIDQLHARHAGLKTQIKQAQSTQQAVQDRETLAIRDLAVRNRADSFPSGARSHESP